MVGDSINDIKMAKKSNIKDSVAICSDFCRKRDVLFLTQNIINNIDFS